MLRDRREKNNVASLQHLPGLIADSLKKWIKSTVMSICHVFKGVNFIRNHSTSAHPKFAILFIQHVHKNFKNK